MKNVLKKVFSIFTAIIFVVIYFYDRAICFFIPVVNHFNIKIWFNDEEEIRNSLIRTIVVSFSWAVTYGCVTFIKWVI